MQTYKNENKLLISDMKIKVFYADGYTVGKSSNAGETIATHIGLCL